MGSNFFHGREAGAVNFLIFSAAKARRDRELGPTTETGDEKRRTLRKSRMDGLPNFLSYGTLLAQVLRARASSSSIITQCERLLARLLVKLYVGREHG